MSEEDQTPHMPSDVSPEVGVFDRFADTASKLFSKPWFFAFCLLIVLLWAPSFLVIGNIDTWQLIINTTTTIVTFLMVALLQNTQTRQDLATQDKLNAIARALADLSENMDTRKQVRDEIEAAVGLEDKESA
jgi:low affinity Fe/Cu permease